MRLALASLVLAAAALPAAAQGSPPTDCAKAPTPVEQAICADPQLSALDKGIRDAFAKAQGRVDKDALKALQKDQKDFLSERAMVFDNKSMPLADYLKNRLGFLERLENAAWGREASAFVGTWRSSLGEVRVTKDEAGGLVVAISTLSPAENKWVCDIEGQVPAPKNGRLEFADDEVKITLVRRGSALVVGDQIPQGDGGRPFCGANGYIDGAFFKVR
jgi:uncharacterized protein